MKKDGDTMALDPQTKMVLDQLAAAGMPSLETIPLEQARMAQTMPQAGEPEPVGKVENRTIPGPDGEIPVRVYYPKDAKDTNPGLVYYHGGGWVLGNLDSHDAICRSITNHANCVTISVDYRLAPENKFPAAVEDAYASVKYVYDHAEEFQVDRAQIAVGGDSAGGNLAAVVTHMAKEKKTPEICYQLLLYPSTAAGAPPTQSRIENAEGYFLTGSMMDWFYKCYVNSDEDKSNPLFTPMFFEDFNGLPPAIVITAEFDPLRDEGEAYAKKLEEAGVEVECIRYDGTIHGFASMAAVLDLGKDALEKAGKGLKKAFSKADGVIG